MALSDFIQNLQETDIVYSTPSQAAPFKVDNAPQVNTVPSIKVIPPEDNVLEKPSPMVIKLNIKKPIVQKLPPNNNMNVVDSEAGNKDVSQPNQPITPVVTPVVTSQSVKPISNPISESVVDNTTPVSVTNNTTIVITEDELFTNSGTELGKKQIWMEYYIKAKTSRKSNPIVDRMKIGRFTITPDNKVLLLPDYDIVGKDPDDVLKDKWF